MGRDSLHDLSVDVAGWLLAGTQSARNDGSLEEHKTVIRALGDRVPTLARVLQQLTALGARTGHDSSRALLDLSVSTSVIAASLSRPLQLSANEVELERGAPVASTLRASDLLGLVQALQGEGDAPKNVIEEALASKPMGDIRLLPLWIEALDVPVLRERVMNDVLPVYGDVSRVALLQLFEPRGAATDAWRLRALARLGGPSVLETVMTAWDIGSDRVRAAAIESMALLNADSAQKAALRMLRAGGPHDLRVACVRALRLSKASSDVALAAVLEALHDTRTQPMSVQVLIEMNNVEVVPRLIQRMDQDVVTLRGSASVRAKKASRGPQRRRTREARLQLGHHIVNIFAQRLDTRAVGVLMRVWQSHVDVDLREAAGAALRVLGTDVVLEAMEQRVFASDGTVDIHAVNALLSWQPERGFDRFALWFDKLALSQRAGVARAVTVLTLLGESAETNVDELSEAFRQRVAMLTTSRQRWREDSRWGDLILGLLEHKTLSARAVVLAGQMRDVRAVPVLLKLLRTQSPSRDVVEALGNIGDVRAVQTVLDVLARSTNTWMRRACLESLRRMDSEQAIAPLRAMLLPGKHKPRLDREEQLQLLEVIAFLARNRA